MPLTISQDCMAAMSIYAAAAYPDECCGLLLGRVRYDGTTAYAARPCNGGSSRGYRIDPADWLSGEEYAADVGFEVVGVYHSHPDCEPIPSECDREHAMPGLSYAILSCVAGKATAARSWRLRPNGSGFDEETIVLS